MWFLAESSANQKEMSWPWYEVIVAVMKDVDVGGVVEAGRDVQMGWVLSKNLFVMLYVSGHEDDMGMKVEGV